MQEGLECDRRGLSEKNARTRSRAGWEMREDVREGRKEWGGNAPPKTGSSEL